MSEVDALNECIETGKCSAVLFKLKGCPSCEEMREKLDDLGLEYGEREVDDSDLRHFNRNTVPFLHVSQNKEDDNDQSDLVIENETIERIREKLGSLEIPDDD